MRFKTGTPPRVNAKTIDYSKTEIQPGDDVGRAFSFETTEYILDQLPCWLTYTNDRTHKVIDDNLHLSKNVFRYDQRNRSSLLSIN